VFFFIYPSPLWTKVFFEGGGVGPHEWVKQEGRGVDGGDPSRDSPCFFKGAEG